MQWRQARLQSGVLFKLSAKEREARLLSRRIVTDLYHNTDAALKRSIALAGIDEEQDLISHLIHGSDRITDKQLAALTSIAGRTLVTVAYEGIPVPSL